MEKINNKGFTLIEVLAVVVIIGVLALVMIPAVGGLLSENKENQYKNLEKSITSAAKIFISDYRYEITLAKNDKCNNESDKRKISTIKDIELTDSKITLQMLVNDANLSTNEGNKIINPKNDKEIDLDNSYIIVKYSCKTKDYIFENAKIIEK